MTSGDFIGLRALPGELARLGVRISYKAAHQSAARGAIPAGRIGHNWVISRSDVPGIARQIAATRGIHLPALANA